MYLGKSSRRGGSPGYEVTRQTGSHLRLTTEVNGEHHITIPNHDRQSRDAEPILLRSHAAWPLEGRDDQRVFG